MHDDSHTTQVIMAEVTDSDDNKVRWFPHHGCVVHDQEQAEVFVGGMLIGALGRRDVGLRNLLLVGLAKDRKVHKGRLAEAFGLGAERLRPDRLLEALRREEPGPAPRRPAAGAGDADKEPDADVDYKTRVQRYEARLIRDALEQTGWIKAEAARRLRIPLRSHGSHRLITPRAHL